MTDYSLSQGAARMARIAAEASNGETGVKAPDRAWAGSVVSNLVALKPEETFVRNKEVFELSADLETRAAVLNKAKHDIRKSASAAIARAKTITEGHYTTESAVICTDSGRVFACVFITRLADAQSAMDDEL